MSELEKHIISTEKRQTHYTITSFLVAIISVFIYSLYILIAKAISKEIPIESVFIIDTVGQIGLYISIGYILYYKTFKNFRVNEGYVLFISILHILSILIIIYEIGTYRSFKTEAFLFIIIWMSVGVLQASVITTVVTGLMAIGGYLYIITHHIIQGQVLLGTISEAFTSEVVSVTNMYLELLTLFILTIIFSLTAKSHRKKIND